MTHRVEWGAQSLKMKNFSFFSLIFWHFLIFFSVAKMEPLSELKCLNNLVCPQAGHHHLHQMFLRFIFLIFYSLLRTWVFNSKYQILSKNFYKKVFFFAKIEIKTLKMLKKRYFRKSILHREISDFFSFSVVFLLHLGKIQNLLEIIGRLLFYFEVLDLTIAYAKITK